jgi:hypothetical protein
MAVGGCRISISRSLPGHAEIMYAAINRPMPVAMMATSGRHLGEGRRPSGNSSSSRVPAQPAGSSHSQALNQNGTDASSGSAAGTNSASGPVPSPAATRRASATLIDATWSAETTPSTRNSVASPCRGCRRMSA